MGATIGFSTAMLVYSKVYVFLALRYFMICLLVNGQPRFPDFQCEQFQSQFHLIFKRLYVIIFIIVTIMVELSSLSLKWLHLAFPAASC